MANPLKQGRRTHPKGGGEVSPECRSGRPGLGGLWRLRQLCRVPSWPAASPLFLWGPPCLLALLHLRLCFGHGICSFVPAALRQCLEDPGLISWLSWSRSPSPFSPLCLGGGSHVMSTPRMGDETGLRKQGLSSRLPWYMWSVLKRFLAILCGWCIGTGLSFVC